MNAAIEHLKAEGYRVREEDVERLSPLSHEHINMLGRYTFTLPEPDMALCDTQHVLEVSRARNAVEAPALGRR